MPRPPIVVSRYSNANGDCTGCKTPPSSSTLPAFDLAWCAECGVRSSRLACCPAWNSDRLRRCFGAVVWIRGSIWSALARHRMWAAILITMVGMRWAVGHTVGVGVVRLGLVDARHVSHQGSGGVLVIGALGVIWTVLAPGRRVGPNRSGSAVESGRRGSGSGGDGGAAKLWVVSPSPALQRVAFTPSRCGAARGGWLWAWASSSMPSFTSSVYSPRRLPTAAVLWSGVLCSGVASRGAA